MTSLYTLAWVRDWLFTLSIQICTTAVADWFMNHDLLPNPSKLEAMVTGSKCQIDRASCDSVKVADADIQLSDNVKIVGLAFDKNLSFNCHISNVVKNCNYHIKSLRHIGPLLDIYSAKTVACSLVGSRLDYCNSFLYGISCNNLNRLQRTQNTLARVVCKAKKQSSPSPLLKSLHWLPIAERINYKIALTVFKARAGLTPGYISQLLVTL